MRFSSTTLTVLFGLVAAAVAAPMGGDAASDLHARNVVFERSVYDSVYNRSVAHGEDGLSARAGDHTIDVQIRWSQGTQATEPANEKDALKIVEFVTRSVWPVLEVVKNGQAATLGELITIDRPLGSIADLHWYFKVWHGKKCEGWCQGFASAVAGAGGVNAIKTAHVKTSRGVVLWEKRADQLRVRNSKNEN